MRIVISYMPMQIGEVRSYCTKILRKKESTSVVSALLIQDWLSSLVFSVFGPDVTLTRNSLKYPSAVKSDEPIEAHLKLDWRRRIPGSADHLASFETKVLRIHDRKDVAHGSFVIVIPADVAAQLT